MTPTIGRKVWYRGNGVDAIHRDTTQPLDATIVYVHADGRVNLVVFDAVGNHHQRGDVFLRAPEAELPEADPYCEWMPYQIGQAAKAGA